MNKNVIYQKTILLSKVDGYGIGRRSCKAEIQITLKIRPGTHRTVDLEDTENPVILSIVGSVWNHIHTDVVFCGQCYERLLKLLPDSELLQRIVKVWKHWHLNDLRAGTREQQAIIDEYRQQNPDWQYDYIHECEVLAAYGLLVDRGCKYGTAWLVELLPNSVVAEVMSW